MSDEARCPQCHRIGGLDDALAGGIKCRFCGWRDEIAVRCATLLECAEMAEKEADDYDLLGSAASALYALAARYRQMAEGEIRE